MPHKLLSTLVLAISLTVNSNPDSRYLIIGKRNENALFRIDLKSRKKLK